MKDQNHSNHRSYYITHHLIFYPLILIFAGGSFWHASEYPDRSLEFRAIGILFLMLGWLSYMMRQHYALGNQDRIIRVEMRLRYFQLTGKSFEPIEKQLSTGQIVALRFTSDEQLLPLIQHTIDQDLSPGRIKKAVQNWQPDHMRV